MRYEKSIGEVKGTAERLTLSQMRERGLCLDGMRVKDGLIVRGEGTAEEGTFSASCERIFACGGGLYGYSGTGKTLTELRSNVRYTGLTGCPVSVVGRFDENMTQGIFVLQENRAYELKGGKLSLCSSFLGGSALMFSERLFFAKGRRLYFTAPMGSGEFSNAERDPDGFAYIDFSDPIGEIAALAVLADRLYLFFERGILRLQASGEAVGFSADVIRFGGGKIDGKSVASTGEGIYFFTEKGMWRLDGSSVKRIETDGAGEIVSFSGAFSSRGRYAAAVTVKDGKAVYIYEPVSGFSHFVRTEGLTDASAEEEIYLLAGNKVLRLTEEVSAGMCSLTLRFPSDRRLGGVCVRGRGTFTVTDGKLSRSGEAGRFLRLRGPREGGMTLTVSTETEDFFISSVEPVWEDGDDD